jgi:hypothetical protein
LSVTDDTARTPHRPAAEQAGNRIEYVGLNVQPMILFHGFFSPVLCRFIQAFAWIGRAALSPRRPRLSSEK